MKHLIPITVLLLMVVLGCEKDEDRVVVGTYTAPVLSTSGGTFVLTEAEENNTFATFVWSQADFGFAAPVSYTVEFDQADNSFADPKIIGITINDTLTITIGDMNNKLLSAGAIADLADDYEFRVMAAVHTDVDTLYSAAIDMNITPYEKIVIYPSLYVPGSYQDNWDASLGWGEWDAANEYTKVYSVKDDGKYEGYLYFNEAETYFKFTGVPEWVQDQTYGDADAGGESGTLLLNDWGNNIKITSGAGYYLVKADLNAATYSATLTDWGLIGDATEGGWDADENMTYDPVSDTWSITTDLTAGGNIKFRANDDWTINYGDPLGNGRLAQDGANILVSEDGNYTITMDLSEAIYTYTVVKN